MNLPFCLITNKYILTCFLAIISALGSSYGNTRHPASGKVSSEPKPNVVFIVVDDMNGYSVLKNYPILKTPAIDKLVSQSYFFENATCAAPMCSPSRGAFFSGLYPHTTGLYFNGINPYTNSVLATTELLPETFKRNGYTTWGRGKSFHFEIGKLREEAMFDNRPIAKGGYGPFSGKEDWYGANNWGTIKPWEGPDSDFADVVNGDAAISFLGKKHDKPFFLYYGLWRPHTPYTAPKRFFDMYRDEDMTLPPGFKEDDLRDVPAMGKELSQNGAAAMKYYTKEGLTPKQVWLKLMKAYCANTSFSDWNLGRVLDALDKSDYAKNTIVVFCSDNGFHNGTKDRWEKSTLWEQADMVPFLIRLPNGKAYRCPQTVSLIDIYPTLVEYCKINGPKHQLEGRSMVPVLNNPKFKWDRPGFTSYGDQFSSVRSERYRYIRYPDGTQELYDHRSDPYENTNIAHKSENKAIIDQLARSIPKSFKKPIEDKSAAGNKID